MGLLGQPCTATPPALVSLPGQADLAHPSSVLQQSSNTVPGTGATMHSIPASVK